MLINAFSSEPLLTMVIDDHDLFWIHKMQNNRKIFKDISIDSFSRNSLMKYVSPYCNPSCNLEILLVLSDTN